MLILVCPIDDLTIFHDPEWNIFVYGILDKNKIKTKAWDRKMNSFFRVASMACEHIIHPVSVRLSRRVRAESVHHCKKHNTYLHYYLGYNVYAWKGRLDAEPPAGHGPLTRYVKLRFAHAPGIPGTFSPPSRVSDPDMHHGTCVTHVPWCMSGSLTSGFLWSRWRGKTFPAFPAHAQPAIFRIW